MKSRAMFAFAAGLVISGAISGSASAQRADADGDGHISLAEFQASRSGALLARDGDGDGRVSASEWAAGGMKARSKAQRRDPAKAFARLTEAAMAISTEPKSPPFSRAVSPEWMRTGMGC